MAAENAFTWSSFVPELKNGLASVGIDPDPAIDMTVASSLLVLLAYLGGRKYRAKGTSPPPKTLSLGSLMEIVVSVLYGFVQNYAEKLTGKLFPFMAGIFLFILFNNLIGSVPGFNTPSDKLSTTLTLAVFVFVLYQSIGFSLHGFGYLKQFCGPIWWMAWLILPIEIISHFVRPASLALRLFGNMTGDHKVVAIFFGFFPLLLPIPFLGLGLFVSFVQAFVFLLLSLVYVSGSLSEEH